MKTKIWQLYFRNDQLPHLLPGFTPFDNTANLTPDLREYPLIKQCRDLALDEGIDLWGAIPWSWYDKCSLDHAGFLTHIDRNPGYDVYFFNPFANHMPIVYNVWEQGQWCHPNMVAIMEEIFSLMGYPNALYQPMSRADIFWGSVCIGNEKFWDQYFIFADRYIEAIDQLTPEGRRMHDGDTSYRGTSLTHFSFIQERLMSTFVSLNTNGLKIMPYQHCENFFGPEGTIGTKLFSLSMLKTIGIERREPYILNQWRHLRNQVKPMLYPNQNIDWAEKWIPKWTQQ